MSRRGTRVIYGLVIGGLVFANVSVALARYGGAGSDASTHVHDAATAAWWRNYHWHKSTISSSVSSSNTEALRAINVWNGRTDLTLPSASVRSADINVVRAMYGPTGWRGLAELTRIVRDSHCDNAYCEIKHCIASLNTYYTGTSWRYQGTYCMEMGHCFGLAHDTDAGCMNSSAMNSGTSNTPSDANIRAINARY